MTAALPYDKFILADGFNGDLWLTGTYITPELRKCIVERDRKTATKIIHSKYLNGFHWYMKNIEMWKKVIDPQYVDSFTDLLMHEISEEIHDTYSEDFISPYIFKTRVRRAITSLPRLIFGSKSCVILPFCDFEFFQKALSIPIEYKLNHSLYKALLERSKQGLSSICSTNTTDADKLEPYLVDSESGHRSWRDQIVNMIQEHYPRLNKVLKRMKNMVSGSDNDSVWIKEIFENPPNLFMDVLTPELKQAIQNGNTAYVRNYRFFIDVIMLLNSFLAEQEISCK